jgi:hypothetical protein
MNANDYLEIEEQHAEQIFEDWTNTLTFDDIPSEYITMWIESYLQGNK